MYRSPSVRNGGGSEPLNLYRSTPVLCLCWDRKSSRAVLQNRLTKPITLKK